MVDTFRAAIKTHGPPASTLTDNGLVYTTRFAGRPRRTQRLRERAPPTSHHPEELATEPPDHLRQGRTLPPDHQAWLAQQPAAANLTELQAQLDTFADLYNHHRPTPLPRRRTPAAVYTTRPKATPGTTPPTPTYRVRHDSIDKTGIVTLRHHGRLHHIGIGRTHARTHVVLLVDDLDIRVINATTGELLRHLTLDPTRDYQPTGRPPGPPPKT